MERLPVLMATEWEIPIMVGLFFVCYGIMRIFTARYEKKNPVVAQYASKIPLGIGYYFFWGVLIGILPIVKRAFSAVALFSEVNASVTEMAWAVILFAFAYSILYLRSLCNIVSCKPGALMETRIFLFTLPIITPMFTFPYYWLCLSKAGMRTEFYIYDYFEAPSAFYTSCLLVIPSLLYFCLSNEVLQLWDDIEREVEENRGDRM